MLTISVETEPAACRELWDQLIQQEKIADLWEFRACFHDHFKRKLFFVVAKESGKVVGFIPLCFIEEHNYHGYFPGEVWQKKTWLEQNRLIAQDQNVLTEMLHWLEENNIFYYLRYLCAGPPFLENSASEDEVGYLFYPKTYHYSIDEYYSAFSKKSIKAILREVDRLYEEDLIICNDQANDFEEMVMLNIERFGTQSYFANNQFVKSFRALRDYLEQKGWLKMTTVVIDGRVAAVDMGCVYNGHYTLLAGGTHCDYPGVAKVINLHHMQTACKNKYDSVDFLCGDFSWKKIFRLSPRPLYKLVNESEPDVVNTAAHLKKRF